MSPTLSVIVPVYNVEDTLEKCVYSILRQEYTDIEVILVDDGATDLSGTICDRLAEEDERIVVLHKSNGGLSSARNAGLDLARGRFVSFVDSDDWISKDFYLPNIDLLLSHSEIDLVLTSIKKVYTTHTSRVQSEWAEGIYLGKSSCVDVMYSQSTLSLCMGIYRKEVWVGLRFTEGILFEDSFIVPDLVDRVSGIAISRSGTYYYLQRQGSIMHSEWSIKKTEDYLRATIKTLKCLSSYAHREYTYRYTGAVHFFVTNPVVRKLSSSLREEFLNELSTLPYKQKNAGGQGKRLPLRHWVFLQALKLFGVHPLYNAFSFVTKG